jgi:GAF domain-containing protein
MELVAAELHADEVACLVLTHEGGSLVTVASHGWQSPGEEVALESLPASRHVVETGDALQVLASDPHADPAELQSMAMGAMKSMIKLPITARGQTTGMLAIRSGRERPWTRTEIYRARLISHQLGAVLDSLLRVSPEPDPAALRDTLASTAPGAIREAVRAA